MTIRTIITTDQAEAIRKHLNEHGKGHLENALKSAGILVMTEKQIEDDRAYFDSIKSKPLTLMFD